METGAISRVGSKLNKDSKPTIYLEKHYPIKGRKDFYKWVIQTPTGLATDFQGKAMYFDSFEFWRAKAVMDAKRRLAKMNKQFLN